MFNNHIFWIAPYPKSGNTLLRSILISLFFTNNGIFKLKMLQYINQFEKIEKNFGKIMNKYGYQINS